MGVQHVIVWRKRWDSSQAQRRVSAVLRSATFSAEQAVGLRTPRAVGEYFDDPAQKRQASLRRCRHKKYVKLTLTCIYKTYDYF